MLGCALSVSADVAFSDVAPTTHILATTTLGSIDTSLFPLTGTVPAPIAGNDNHARGQLFSLGEGTGSAFQITAIVLQKNVAATFASDLLTLRIFQGTEEEWVTGTGHLATDTNFYNGTGVTPLYDEAFTLDGLIDDNEFVTLELATPLTVRERADFGFYTLPRDGTLEVPARGVLGNDIDLNRDLLTASTQMTTTHGLLTLLGDGSLTYQPEPGFAGIDTFTYTASDGQFTSAPAAVTLTVEGEPSGYYTWRQSITWNPGQDEGSPGDPDGDGLSNLLEFALGLDPLLPDLTGLPTLVATETGADFSFSNTQPGVVYEVLTSPDLVTWSEPAFATLTSESPMPVSIPASEAVGGRLFVRLQVTE